MTSLKPNQIRANLETLFLAAFLLDHLQKFSERRVDTIARLCRHLECNSVEFFANAIAASF
jgi:DNA-binding Xre family transcriptional regulator